MLNLNKKVKFSKKQKKYIRSLGISQYKDWDSGKKDNKEIKQNIKNQLLQYQNNKCVYCGLPLEETSRPEIEHIAPRDHHPEFEYTITNLAMSCQYCNGSSKKGKRETILTKNSFYNQCQFKIVHPYYDDVDKFFVEEGALIMLKPNLLGVEKSKAQLTIEIFKLTDEKQVEARQKMLCYEKFMKNYTKNQINEMLINDISIYI